MDEGGVLKFDRTPIWGEIRLTQMTHFVQKSIFAAMHDEEKVLKIFWCN